MEEKGRVVRVLGHFADCVTDGNTDNVRGLAYTLRKNFCVEDIQKGGQGAPLPHALLQREGRRNVPIYLNLTGDVAIKNVNPLGKAGPKIEAP